jgi:hypothetical protein
MKRFYKYFSLALLALPFASCDREIVSRAEYEAAVARADELEGRNDSLELELSDLKMYVGRLEEENTELTRIIETTGTCLP